MRIGPDAYRVTLVVLMVSLNRIHDGNSLWKLYRRGICQKIQKVILKRHFVGSVICQLCAEALVVSVCKSVSCIVDQLSHSVVVQQIPM